MKKRTWVIINHDPEPVISRLHLSKQVLCSCIKQRLNLIKLFTNPLREKRQFRTNNSIVTNGPYSGKAYAKLLSIIGLYCCTQAGPD